MPAASSPALSSLCGSRIITAAVPNAPAACDAQPCRGSLHLQGHQFRPDISAAHNIPGASASWLPRLPHSQSATADADSYSAYSALCGRLDGTDGGLANFRLFLSISGTFHFSCPFRPSVQPTDHQIQSAIVGRGVKGSCTYQFFCRQAEERRCQGERLGPWEGQTLLYP
jgi:hypothetical protein